MRGTKSENQLWTKKGANPSPLWRGGHMAEAEIPKAELQLWAWDWERHVKQRERPQPRHGNKMSEVLRPQWVTSPGGSLKGRWVWGCWELRPKWDDLDCLPAEFGLNFWGSRKLSKLSIFTVWTFTHWRGRTVNGNNRNKGLFMCNEPKC